MSEYWKSTPRYWCKYCAVYVRDTKLERANHESTGRHQGALKRALRDLHRSHDRDERDKDRAKREIDRLNGVVIPSTSTAAGGSQLSNASSKPTPPLPSQAVATEASLKRQREQLAELGVAIPDSFRSEMAMPGEWTVTSTRIIQTSSSGDNEPGKVEARASGVRKREETEEEAAHEEAIKGLFKRPKRWGRDSKALGDDQEEAELEALLSGSLVKKEMKKNQESDDGAGEGEVVKKEEGNDIKSEEGREEENGPEFRMEPPVKDEPDTAAASGCLGEVPTRVEAADAGAGAAVVFKKRKPKGLRTK